MPDPLNAIPDFTSGAGGQGCPAMRVIHDPPADGPSNMARDAALLDGVGGEAILRIYGWDGDWVSYGYFQSADIAEAHFPGVNSVRRPTGGGLVDHRDDFTYTLVFPKDHPLCRQTRAESYLAIHALVAEALRETGLPATLVERETGDSPACFDHPVPGDVIGSDGRKLAGAAQRRTRKGLLHQGSLVGIDDMDRLRAILADKFRSL